MPNQAIKNRKEKGKYYNWLAEQEQKYRGGEGKAFFGENLNSQFDWTVSTCGGIETDDAAKIQGRFKWLNNNYS